MPATLDHLVIAARTLEAGVQWCEATLGLTPELGGAHPLMGTHNRLLNISSPDFPRAYLEIIAIDPAAAPMRAPGQRRWFDLDDTALQATLARDGAALIHFVARTDAIDADAQALRPPPLNMDLGPAIGMFRDAPQGRLHWRITVREDGHRLCHGAVPTLIQRDVPSHPADTLPDRGLRLRGMRALHPDAATLATALRHLGLRSIDVETGPADLIAVLDTPRGAVALHSQGR